MRKKFRSVIITAALLFSTAITSSATFASSSVGARTSHFDRGCELFDMGRWVDARLEFQAALDAKSSPLNLNKSQLHELKYKLAMCEVNLNRMDGLNQIFDFSEKYPYTQYSNDILYTRSILEMADGNLSRAYDLMNQVDASGFYRNDLDAYNIRKGYLAFHKKDFKSARSYFAQINGDSEYYPHALYFISYMAYEGKNLTTARSGFERLTKNAQYAPLMPYYLLHIEFLEGDYRKTINIGTKIITNSTGISTRGMMRILAEAYFRIGDQDSAIKYLNRYIELGGPVGRSEQYLKGFSLQITGEYRKAIDELKNVCGPDDALTQNAAFHLANCYIKVGDKQSAMMAFSMAGNDKINSEIAEEALFNYAKLQSDIDSDNTDRTINILTRYIDTYSNEDRVDIIQNLLIAAYYNVRDYATAYDKISKIENPDANMKAAKQKITYLRGLEQYIDGNYDGAEELLRESIEIGVTPKQIALANFWLGEIEYSRGDYREAISRYNYFVSRAPSDDKTIAAAKYGTAYSLLYEGNSSSALIYFNEALRAKDCSDDMKADIYNRIGDIHYGKREFTEANSNYNRAIRVADEDAKNYAKLQIAIIKGVQGDSKSKLQLLNEIQDGKFADNAAFERARTYVDINDYQTAVNAYNSFLRRYEASELYAQALSGLGVAYSNLSDIKNALKYYDQAIKKAPNSQVAIDALNGIKELYIGRGEAKKYFEYAKSIGLDSDLNVAARDSLSFASARELYLAGGKTREGQRVAARALNDYINSFPKGYYLNDALFYVSDALVKTGEPSEAIKKLTQLTNRGVNNYSERSYKILSKLTFEQGMYREAAAANRKLYDIATDKATKETALASYATSTIRVADAKGVESMINDITKLGESRAGLAATLEAKFARATILRERGERKDALPLYEDIVKRSKSKERVGEARYYIIDNAVRLGNLDRAEQMVYDFAEAKPADSYWLAKSFLLLGDIYINRGDKFQARATLQSLIDGYSANGDGIIEEAKRKISEL
ncbi:MAG: tetratricopeptide repeat protein [Rikenellaceae bacterium]